MRKPDKSALAKRLKGYINVTKSPVATKLVIDGGWLLYQCSYVSGETYVNIAKKYLRLVKDVNKDITVVFNGYKPSPKDHDHKRINKSFDLQLPKRDF